jgi:undecaprenyl diphosphate synthase
VYAFSTENWRRPDDEVKGIFRLMEHFFKTEIQTCVEKGVRLRILGSLSRLSKSSQKVVREAEDKTKDCAKLNVQIAVSYGGRDEILRAVKKMYDENHDRPDFFENLDEAGFENYLDTAGIPGIDLIIRTGAAGRKRTSGFFPWQSVYAELYFLDTLWPDFSQNDLRTAVDWYRGVVRNIGT